MNFTVDGLRYDASPNLRTTQLPDSIIVSTYIPQNASSPPISLNLKFPKAVGTYNLTSPGAGSADFTSSFSSNADKYYAGTKAGTVFGSGAITVDSYANGTATGTFYFTGQNPQTGAFKTVTDGRFSAR